MSQQKIEANTNVTSRSQEEWGRGRIVSISGVGSGRQAIVEFADGRLERIPVDDLLAVQDPITALARGDYDSSTAFDLRVKGAALQAEHIRTGSLSNARIEPLPHQILLIDKILNQGLKAHLIADDVGLGKTIEAGMLYLAYASRGLADRTLIVTPAGLCLQWQEVLEDTFGVVFDVFNRDFIDARPETWNRYQRVIGSLDALKRNRPMEDGGHGRRDMLEEADPWDLVIFDEAHRLSANEKNFGVDRTQNYQLAEMLRERCQYFYLLTATPHQGKDDRFRHLLRLVNPEALPRNVFEEDIDGHTLNGLMSRSRKSEVTDMKGRLLFRGHEVIPVNCPLEPPEDEFYESLTHYLATGFGRSNALDETMQRAVGFVMVTFQKLAASSLAAIERALQRRFERLTGTAFSASPKEFTESDVRFQGESEERSEDLVSPRFFEDEEEMLAGLLRQLAGLPRDSKVRRLLAEIEDLDRMASERERAPEHILVFTEYRASQALIVEALEEQFGEGCCLQIHGDMKLNMKRSSQRRFAQDIRFLVSTEAGGEGINLHERSHILFNFDIPWNPMRLHQRIGRLDRYGQKHQVIAYNLFRTGTIEEHIRQRLDQKIQTIMDALRELEGDRSEDLREAVLGQVGVELDINSLYARAIRESGQVPENEFDEGMNRVRKAVERITSLYGMLDSFDFRSYQERPAGLSTDDLNSFVRRYISHRRKRVYKNEDGSIRFNVPDELRIRRLDPRNIKSAVFDRRQLQNCPEAKLLGFGDTLVNRMVSDCLTYEFGGEVCYRRLSSPPQQEVPSPGYQFVFAIRRRPSVAQAPLLWEIKTALVCSGAVDQFLSEYSGGIWSAGNDAEASDILQSDDEESVYASFNVAQEWLNAQLSESYSDEELGFIQTELLACAKVLWE